MSSVPTILREKEPGLLDELAAADPRLRVLALYAAAVSMDLFRVLAVVTRVNGNRDQTISFHGAAAGVSVHEVRPTRGADLRTRGLLDDKQAQEWEYAINARIEYSPPNGRRRFSAALYETQEKMLARGRDPNLPPVVPHLHLQVPPWTSKVSGPMVRLWTMGAGST